jgi:photosystem II stability/assembly factor-like uncharacterized protein
MWNLDRISVPESRALVACASLHERELAVAVGSHGTVLRVERGCIHTSRLEQCPNLAAAAVDVLDRTWVGAAGELWVSPAPGTEWKRIWRDETWRAPFISIHADVGLVVAMTADGGVLECRASLSSAGLPPVSRLTS